MLFAPLAVPGLSLFLRFTHGQCNAAMLLARMAASFQVHYTGPPDDLVTPDTFHTVQLPLLLIQRGEWPHEHRPGVGLYF